ncbi:hypothetical protein tb265_06790 [Gemmatimonadetes bacterium T265]|nr:hypothetical protein tb265_06790 [Gemmatimonadetes bacterium T265]
MTAALPPRWTETVVRGALPDDPMRDAILGDLHEEFVRDALRRGPAHARARHRRRAAGVVAHAVVDALRWRAWASPAPSAAAPRAPRPHPAAAPRAVAPPGRGARVGSADVCVGALAFSVLLLGVVSNTILFSTARHVPRAAGAPAPDSAVGAGAVTLALLCAGAAAFVLCAGPRWIRRRRAAAPRYEPGSGGG